MRIELSSRPLRSVHSAYDLVLMTTNYVMRASVQGSDDFEEFVRVCGEAFNVIRSHAHEFINLFQVMAAVNPPSQSARSRHLAMRIPY